MPCEEETPEYPEPTPAWRWRFAQARRAGLTAAQARSYADSDSDAWQLERLSQAGCPPELIAEIVL